MATLQNRAGRFVAPSVAFTAVASQTVTADNHFEAALLVDPQQAEAYPIVELTYLLLYERYANPAKAEVLKQYIRWALQDGAKLAEELGYVPLPDKVVGQVLQMIQAIP
ncbi:MAG: substrate-binding domain-containing protein [Synechococcales cyanobacterium C42_A2020_086]|jgi:phosphate transport system substrate-binding protein|nr:substrate-binding domain-containing protein [Synechococcales cyanobacterium C42_A2020_086]